jgi:calpain-7
VLKSFEYGDVMITLGTGKLSCKEERELGLAGAHDYAVLDMKETSSQRQLLIKNPWCDGMVWKGFRGLVEEEQEHAWPKDLSVALPERSPTVPGTFWMDYEDVVQHFESLYLNWNPGLFLYRQDHHFSWIMAPIKNPDSFIYNPQYTVKCDVETSVWILLSRHFATGEHDIVKEKPLPDASIALGFISLYIFDADGHRVYLGDDALHRGAFVDSPQTLARLDTAPGKTYTIAAAQHDLPLPKYSFTLSIFSRSPLIASPAPDPLPHLSTLAASWTSRSAGGNAQSPTYPTNPQFSIRVPSPTPLTLFLETPVKDIAVHVSLVWGAGNRVSAVTTRDLLGGSGEYRRGCALVNIPHVAEGTYTIICSTFEAGQTGAFTLRVSAAVSCSIAALPSEDAGRLSLRLPRIVFREGVERMLSPLTAARMTRLRVVARGVQGWTGARRPLLRVAVERGQGPNKLVLDVSDRGEFNDVPMGVRTVDLDVSPASAVPGGFWIVVERLGGGEGDAVDVEVLSDGPVQVGLWGTGDG